MPSPKQLLLLYATDTYKLSSLLIRRVLLTKPITLKAYQEKTRQLLLDCQKSQSSNASCNNYNVAAVKLLEWDRELNLIQYYGIQEYTRRWWGSKSWSFGSLSKMVGGSNSRSTSDDGAHQTPSFEGGGGSNKNKKNVARVAFMITSEQRYKLSTELGYTSQDIRSFKPIEALLLLEHGVHRDQSGDEDGFRIKLQQLMEDNDRLMSMRHEHHIQEKPNSDDTEMTMKHNFITNAKQETEANAVQSVSPEEAQKLSTKPDVALALLSVDRDDATKYEDHALESSKNENSSKKSNESASDEDDDSLSPSKEEEDEVVAKKSHLSTSSTQQTSLKRVSLVNVPSSVSEDLQMKPDIAAVLLTAHQTTDEQQQEHMIYYGDEQENPSEEEDIEEDGTCWYEVVEKLPDKIPSVKNANVSDVDKNVMQQPAENATNNNGIKKEQVIALFPTKKEALECVRIKQSFRNRSSERFDNGEEDENERFLVRRRWND